jgi:hypothetical protein
MALLVEDGLRAAKRMKLNETKAEAVSGTLATQPILPVDDLSTSSTPTVPVIESASKVESLPEDTAPVADLVSSESLSIDWLEILSGEVVTHADGLIECDEGFGTIKAKYCSLGPHLLHMDPSGQRQHHRYYYEVELVTAGLFQV